MSKLLATKVSTLLTDNVQIGPKVSIFCVPIIIFQHWLNLLGIELTRASQVATGVLFHSSMMTSQSWWMLETLHTSTSHFRMPPDAQWGLGLETCLASPSTLPSASLARQRSFWRCVWGCYHVGILPCSPALCVALFWWDSTVTLLYKLCTHCFTL